jgi:Leucine-rich repeat (LRR) protein
LLDGGIRKILPSVHFLKRSLQLALTSVALSGPVRAKEAEPPAHSLPPEKEIAALGGSVFREAKTKLVIEVKLNGSANLQDDDLKLVASFKNLTDLSLEGTSLTGAGLAHLSKLKKLEWLNLWQTEVDDKGMAHLAGLPSLQFLPIGGTKITNAGLEHLKGLPLLIYLGLRDTAISDAGVAKLTALPALRELNLRNTKITDGCIVSLGKIRALRKVWLGETKVTKKGLAQLRAALPRCEIDLTTD